MPLVQKKKVIYAAATLRRTLYRSYAQAYPKMVDGERRFRTGLMNAYNGLLIGKLGADGWYGIGVRKSVFTEKLSAKRPLGMGAKIEDENIDILLCGGDGDPGSVEHWRRNCEAAVGQVTSAEHHQ